MCQTTLRFASPFKARRICVSSTLLDRYANHPIRNLSKLYLDAVSLFGGDPSRSIPGRLNGKFMATKVAWRFYPCSNIKGMDLFG